MIDKCSLAMRGLFSLFVVCTVLAVPAYAQNSLPETQPEKQGAESALELSPRDVVVKSAADADAAPFLPAYNTHPDLRLTPDKTLLVSLPRAVSTVVVGNPAHLSVLVDSPKVLVFVGKVPGATHFSALDAKGSVIMQRHVVVASPKSGYLRVRKSCAFAEGDSGDGGCQATSMYYCPDMCHEIAISGGDDEASSSSMDAGAEDMADDMPEGGE